MDKKAITVSLFGRPYCSSGTEAPSSVFCHGLLLSSWGFASLFAFLVSTFVLGVMQLSQNALFGVLAAVYAVNFANVLALRCR